MPAESPASLACHHVTFPCPSSFSRIWPWIRSRVRPTSVSEINLHNCAIWVKSRFDPDLIPIIWSMRMGFKNPYQLTPNFARVIYLLSLLSTQILRNPDHHSRPTFEDITRELAIDPEALLSWSQQDKATSSKAAVLGAPLHEGRHLYPDLQQRY